MLMFVQTTWGEAAFKNTVVGYAFIYGGLLQLLAGLFEVSHTWDIYRASLLRCCAWSRSHLQ